MTEQLKTNKIKNEIARSIRKLQDDDRHEDYDDLFYYLAYVLVIKKKMVVSSVNSKT